MVGSGGASASEAAQLARLEEQAAHGGGGAWEYLCLVRRLKVRRSEPVLRLGLSLLNDSKARSKLGSEEWTLYEQVAIAAMDCQKIDVAKDCIEILKKKFPDSLRVARLEGMLLEAKGAWAEADRAYAVLLENNPNDQLLYKRKIAMAKAQGNTTLAVDYLNKYLEIFMADHDAWRELAEIYVSLLMYKQAAFCYEELILAQPMVALYQISYADVLYTMGGIENIQTAKKYYSSALQLTGGKNTRALYGVCLARTNFEQGASSCFKVLLEQGTRLVIPCSGAINQLSKGRNKEEESSELQALAAEVLTKEYKRQASAKLPLVTEMLKTMKLS